MAETLKIFSNQNKGNSLDVCKSGERTPLAHEVSIAWAHHVKTEIERMQKISTVSTRRLNS